MTGETKITKQRWRCRCEAIGRLSASLVLQEGDETNQIPYYVLLEERATDPRDKEQYGKVAGTRGTLKQLNNLNYAGSGLSTI